MPGTVPLLLGTPAGTTCALQSKPSHDSVGRRPLVLVFPYRENIQIILSCQDQRFLTPFLVQSTVTVRLAVETGSVKEKVRVVPSPLE